MLRQWRPVVVAEKLELLLPVIEDLEEEHPAELLEPLRVAVRAGVLAHDVLDGFDDVGDVRHLVMRPRGTGGIPTREWRRDRRLSLRRGARSRQECRGR